MQWTWGLADNGSSKEEPEQQIVRARHNERGGNIRGVGKGLFTKMLLKRPTSRLPIQITKEKWRILF